MNLTLPFPAKGRVHADGGGFPACGVLRRKLEKRGWQLDMSAVTCRRCLKAAAKRAGAVQ